MEKSSKQKLIASLLAKDLIQHSYTAPANGHEQTLLHDVMSEFNLALVDVAKATSISMTTLDAVAAGNLGLDFANYTKLLRFYCFKQTQTVSAGSSDQAVLLKSWRGLAGTPLSIHAKDAVKTRPKHAAQGKRYYLSHSQHLYLTQREYEMAKALLQSDCAYKTIGKALSLSARTVEYYVANLRTKFNAPSRQVLKARLKKILPLLEQPE